MSHLIFNEKRMLDAYEDVELTYFSEELQT